MEMLLGEMLLPSQADVGFAGDVQGVVYAVLQLALPLLKGIVVLVLVFGVFGAAIELVRMENRRLRGKEYQRAAVVLREHLGYYLLLGLEFLIAVDVLETLLHPAWEELGVLGGLVVLRIMLSLSLGWELKDIRKNRPDAQ